MPYEFITQEQAIARISLPVAIRLFDDDKDGDTDDEPFDAMIQDACAKVAGVLRGIYDLDVVAADPPGEVIRLSLDCFVAMCAMRHPEVMRIDWEPRMKQVDADLKALRRGDTRLDVVGPPEPAANQGGEALSGNPDCPEPKGRFTDNWGDF